MFMPSGPVELLFLVFFSASVVWSLVMVMGVWGSLCMVLFVFLSELFVLWGTICVNCLVNWSAFCCGVMAILSLKVMVALGLSIVFLSESPFIVFQSMCVFCLWSQCPSRWSFHIWVLWSAIALLMSVFSLVMSLLCGSSFCKSFRCCISSLMSCGSSFCLLFLIRPLGIRLLSASKMSLVRVWFAVCTSVGSVMSSSASSMSFVKLVQSALL